MALASGQLTRRGLARHYTRVFRDVYVPNGTRLDARTKAHAALVFGGPQAVLAGLSAAAIHGTKWIDDDAPAEIVRPGFQGAPPGLLIRADSLLDDEIDAYRRATTPARTAFDLGRRLSPRAAIIAIDALCNATGLNPGDVGGLAARHRGVRGLRQLRVVLARVDAGAESPPETVTRLLLVDAGLPTPATQVLIRDEFGLVVARADLGWPEWHVVVEYDGAQHWTDARQRAWDIDRAAALEALGWRVVRVSADLLRNRPHVVVERVRQALRAAHAPV